ncbi:MAG: hypothetical protein V3575_04300 [Candidatus Absconditabacteria bacterium]
MKFNENNYTFMPSPNNENEGFILNKLNGEIFRVENITKEFILSIINSKNNISEIQSEYIKRYSMNEDDTNNFNKFIESLKDMKIII